MLQIKHISKRFGGVRALDKCSFQIEENKITALAFLGSYLLGIVENLGIWFLPSGWKDAIAFGLLFIFLLWKPAGILGIRKGARG